MEKKAQTEMKFRAAMDAAIRILTSRGHTARELALKLKKRRIKPDLADQVVAECKRLNYIDDTDTAQRYLEELKRKNYGRRYVRSAMRKKGIDAATIENTLEEGYTHFEELENAKRLVAKKQSTFNREKDPRKRKSKSYRYLHGRGFSPDTISTVINRRFERR